LSDIIEQISEKILLSGICLPFNPDRWRAIGELTLDVYTKL